MRRPTNVGTETAGWLLGDEFDMSDSSNVKCPDTLNSSKAGLRGRPDALCELAARASPYRRATRGGANGKWWAGGRGAELLDQRRGPRQRGHVLVHRPLPRFQHPLTATCAERTSATSATRTPATGQCTRIGRWWRPGWPFSETAAEGGRAILPAEMRSALWHQISPGRGGSSGLITPSLAPAQATSTPYARTAKAPAQRSPDWTRR